MLPEPGERAAHALETRLDEPPSEPTPSPAPGTPDIATLPSPPVLPKVTSAPPPPSSRVPGAEARPPAIAALAGGLLPAPVRPAERPPARPPRRRRSASQTAEIPHPVDLPEDAGGRILVVAQQPWPEAAPVDEDAPIEAAADGADAGIEGWPAVIVVGAVLVVLFVVCLRLTS